MPEGKPKKPKLREKLFGTYTTYMSMDGYNESGPRVNTDLFQHVGKSDNLLAILKHYERIGFQGIEVRETTDLGKACIVLEKRYHHHIQHAAIIKTKRWEHKLINTSGYMLKIFRAYDNLLTG